MFSYDSKSACKAQFRQFRNRLELADSPFIHDIEAAARRVGIYCRAEAGQTLRDYIWRKQCALIRYERERWPWRPIVNHGRALPLGMGA